MRPWLHCFLFGHEWVNSWLFPFVDGSRCERCGKERPFKYVREIPSDDRQ